MLLRWAVWPIGLLFFKSKTILRDLHVILLLSGNYTINKKTMFYAFVSKIIQQFLFLIYQQPTERSLHTTNTFENEKIEEFIFDFEKFVSEQEIFYFGESIKFSTFATYLGFFPYNSWNFRTTELKDLFYILHEDLQLINWYCLINFFIRNSGSNRDPCMWRGHQDHITHIRSTPKQTSCYHYERIRQCCWLCAWLNKQVFWLIHNMYHIFYHWAIKTRDYNDKTLKKNIVIGNPTCILQKKKKKQVK